MLFGQKSDISSAMLNSFFVSAVLYPPLQDTIEQPADCVADWDVQKFRCNLQLLVLHQTFNQQKANDNALRNWERKP
jgi:hypothetical protein